MSEFKNTVEINRSVENVYIFLNDLNNHEQLMPENIEEWSSNRDEAKFNVKGMIKLSLIVSDRIENQKLVLKPVGDMPFDIGMHWELDRIGTEKTKATFTIDADLNMMMKMIASGPLQKLVTHQTNRLVEVLI